MNINLINPIGQLCRRPSDLRRGQRRDAYGSALQPCQRRAVARRIDYNALALQFGRRLSGGVQFDFNYTIGKGKDNAPLTWARCRSRVTTASWTRRTWNAIVVRT